MEEETMVKAEKEINTEGDPMTLSMNSIMGSTLNNTLKLRGKINGVEVIMMVDSGASHNFISQDLVQKLELPVNEMKAFGEMVGNGFTV